MKNNLPHVYQNPINKEIRNNTNLYYSKDTKNDIQINDIKSPKDISKLANQIFSRKDFVYKSKVKITTFDNDIITNLIGRTSNSLLTLDNQSIPITSITNLEIIN